MLQVKQYRQALSACEKVLEKDPDNVKALYRAGRVLGHMGELEDAVKKLQKALSLSPEDKTIQTELKRTFKKKEQTLRKEKEMYRRMMEPTPPQNKLQPHREAWVSHTSHCLHLDTSCLFRGPGRTCSSQELLLSLQ